MLVTKHTNKFFAAVLVMQFMFYTIPFAQTTPSPTPVNYIREFQMTAPETSEDNIMKRPLSDVKMTTQYLDGLGRSLQTVIKLGSLETVTGERADMVAMNMYDNYGREEKAYLPFPANDANGNTSITNGEFKTNPLDQLMQFMPQQYASQGETFFYGKTIFEESPLNRPITSMSPGNSWVGEGKGVEVDYWFNTLVDGVRKWTVKDLSTPEDFGEYLSETGEVYAAGELYKISTRDEANHQTIEFKDKGGKLILKKMQLNDIIDEGLGSSHADWICTYYLYDDRGNLRCVIQPKGVELLIGNWDLSSNTTLVSKILDEQCFRYYYDSRNRLIMKKVPGAAPISMIYDARDRLAAMQDGNLQKSYEWFYTNYDALNRPISTGIWNTNKGREELQLNALYQQDYPVAIGSEFEELSKTFYDNYNWVSTYGDPLESHYESFGGEHFAAPNNAWPYPQMMQGVDKTVGLTTGARMKVLGTVNDYLYSLNIYDNKGRIIQTKSTNITGGKDITTTQYSWIGQPLMIVSRSKNNAAISQDNIVVSKLTYDDLGRLIKTEKKASNSLVEHGTMPGTFTIVSENEYDKIGQLIKKKLDPSYNDGEGLETQNYEYNIRGWLIGVNRDFIKTENSRTNYFGFEVGYDKTDNVIEGQSYANPQFNGNISGTTWKSIGDNEVRKYDFDYDRVDRLKSAIFNQYTGGNFNQSAGVNYNVSNLVYDLNGNILRMKQFGLKINSSENIDDLYYSYDPYSNKLKNVKDAITTLNNLGDFNDGSSTVNDDYSYDSNGNLVVDQNKNITSILYNHLNLPIEISVISPITSLTNKIKFTYDAAGNKLKKQVIENLTTTNNVTTTILYLDGAVYESKLSDIDGSPISSDYDNKLQYISFDEGRIRFKPKANNEHASLQYDYFLKDHLGNVRMVLTDEKRQDVYPVATLEGDINSSGLPNAVNKEQDYYSIVSSNIENEPNGIPDYDNYIPGILNPNPFSDQNTPSKQMYKLEASSSAGAIGLGLTLRVMSGDKVAIHGTSYYETLNTTNSNNFQVPLLDILTGFLGGTSHASVLTQTHGSVTAAGLSTTPNLSGLGSLLFDNHETDNALSPERPRAYINYLVFDDQFHLVDKGFSQVKNSGELMTEHYEDLQDVSIIKNGYIYVYCSNESPVPVYFDNLQVIHQRGPIMEETHYYPFGLTMAGISSKSAIGLQNKCKFNAGNELQSAEFSDGNSMELYDAVHRMYDPQLGRFWQVDELAEANWEMSVYNFASDNPLRFNDPLGLTDADPKDDPTGELKKTKTLSTVVVSTKMPKLNQGQVQQLYYALEKYGRGTDRIRNKTWRAQVEAYDATAKWLEKYHAGVKEDGMMLLEFASWFIPVGQITKLRYLKYAATLFKIKRGATAFKALKYGSEFGIDTYKALKKISPLGSEVHHLIEKRFAKLFDVSEREMQSIVVTDAEHQAFTNAWRAEIGYEGSKAAITTSQVTRPQVEAAARKIYQNYPEILNALGL